MKYFDLGILRHTNTDTFLRFQPLMAIQGKKNVLCFKENNKAIFAYIWIGWVIHGLRQLGSPLC